MIDGNARALDRYLGEMDAEDRLNDAALDLMVATLDAHDAGKPYGEPEEVAELRAAVAAEEAQDWAREEVIAKSKECRA